MAKRKQNESQEEVVMVTPSTQKTFEDLFFHGLSEHKAKLIKEKNISDLQKLCQHLVFEWTRGRVQL